MVNQVCLFVLLILYIVKVGDGYYYHYRTTERMKAKILFISRELIQDAIRNIQRVEHIKEYYTVSNVYDIGQMLYFIRSKFARLVRLFVLAYDNDKKFANYHLHLPTMKDMHHLGMEIYNLIEMLEDYEVSLAQTVSITPSKKRGRKLQRIKKNDTVTKVVPKYLRQNPTHIPRFPKEGVYNRKPNEMLRNRMKDIDAAFDSDVE